MTSPCEVLKNSSKSENDSIVNDTQIDTYAGVLLCGTSLILQLMESVIMDFGGNNLNLNFIEV